MLMLGTAVEAAILKPLDDLKVIEVPISRQGLTRITVKDDRISNVFGNAGEYVLESDEDQGQIFIRPTGLESLNSISLTLTTEKGHTQDLRLLPKDQAPEALILKEDEEIKPELFKDPFNGRLSETPITRDEIENLFEACRLGRIPLGYKAMPLDLNTLKGPHLLTRELQGEKLRCLAYEVKNKTTSPLTLSEPEFIKSLSIKQSEIVAILMPKKTLTPHEKGAIYVVARSLP